MQSGEKELAPGHWGTMLSGLDGLLHLTVTGGEPFLRNDLVELILASVKSSGVPRISINTNGFLTEKIVSDMETLLNDLPGTELSLAVSLDGPEPVHDALRGVPGSYGKARETVFAVAPFLNRNKRLSLRVSSVLCSENAGALEALMEETSTWPISYHDLGLVRDVPRQDQLFLVKKYLHLTDRQLANASSGYLHGIEWRLQRQVRDAILAHLGEDKERHGPCLAGSRLVEVFPDGTVRGCEMEMMWASSLLKKGGTAPFSLADIVRSPAARRFQQQAARCSCTFECACGCNAIFQPSQWWRLLL